MVELAVVARCHRLEPIPQVVSVEVHEQANEGDIMRWNVLLQVASVGVSERRVVRRDKPLVNTIDADHCLELVTVVALVEEFGESVCGDLGVVHSHLGNFDKFFGITQLITQPIVHGVVLLLVEGDLVFVEVLLPSVVPSFADWVPEARTWLRLVVSHPRNVILAIVSHIDICLSQQLLV